MPTISATLIIPVATPRVYQYLRTRYDSDIFRMASLSTMGFVPQYTCLEAVENEKLSFRAPGYEVLLGSPFGNWKWGYELESSSEAQTIVGIWYKWSLFMLPFFRSIKFQAANELVETALALHALACPVQGQEGASKIGAIPQREQSLIVERTTIIGSRHKAETGRI